MGTIRATFSPLAYPLHVGGDSTNHFPHSHHLSRHLSSEASKLLMAFCFSAHSNFNNICVTSSRRAIAANGRTGASKRTFMRVQQAATSDVSSDGRGNMTAYEEGQLERPRWTGETPLSRLVGALINFRPLFSILKLGARQVLISTAEKTNIPWREMTKEILESEVYKEMESVRNPSVIYPCYYLNPFHAYDEGNLSWLAAAEAEAATMSMVRRAIPDASSLDDANEVVRGNWLRAIEQHHRQHSGNSTIRDILDVGCSVGVSTNFLANKFPSSKITGLDLSPYFLAVAQYKEKICASRKRKIKWIHANGEDTGLPSASFDVVSIAYVLHECPARATVNLVKESFRLLRPGGTIAITDNSPKSKILQELSPVLFTLMKSTEPFLDEYYLLDLEQVMTEAGYVNVHTILTDPRHRTVTATVPR